MLEEIAGTRDEPEIGCDECFEEVDRFVATELAGLDADRAMPLVRQHLDMCGECREEFESLLVALKASGETAPGTPASEALERLLEGTRRPPHQDPG